VTDGDGVMIKPGELAGLLSRPASNCTIQSMKLVTMVVLLASSGLIGVQYYTIVTFGGVLQAEFDQVETLHQLTSEILYMKQYVLSAIVAAPTSDSLSTFADEINQLDALISNVSFSLNTTLEYLDGSSQNMMVGFALSKLVSECNTLSG